MPDRPLPGWPRAMNEEWASAYISLSQSLFRVQVEAGEAPQPVWLTPGRKAWLREDLDAYLDRKAGRSPASDPANDWMKAFDQDGSRGSALR